MPLAWDPQDHLRNDRVCNTGCMSAGVGEFLASRRARLQPEDLGIASYGRRRVPGVRREEVARLANVSVDYYIRLEQGRTPGASDEVLGEIARVLRLDDSEREHLTNLVRVARANEPATSRGPRPVPAAVRRLLQGMTQPPAFALDEHMNIVAWNALADAVVGITTLPVTQRNAARHVFLNPDARSYYRNWDDVAEETVSYLRLQAGRRPKDRELHALVGELAEGSPRFAALWHRQDVQHKTSGPKQLRHPALGDLDFVYETLALPAEPDYLLVVYTARPGSTTAARVAALAAPPADRPRHDTTHGQGRSKDRGHGPPAPGRT